MVLLLFFVWLGNYQSAYVEGILIIFSCYIYITFCVVYEIYYSLVFNFYSLFVVFREQQRAVQVHTGAKRNQLVKVNLDFFSTEKKYSFIFKLSIDYNFFFTECPLGYHSFNCSETCKFPTFGDDCQHICNCSKDLCSHNNGCKISNGMSCTNVRMHCTYFRIYTNNK